MNSDNPQYEDHMHKLAIRISRIIDGEEIASVATLFAGMCGYALSEIADMDDRLRLCLDLQTFMLERAELIVGPNEQRSH